MAEDGALRAQTGKIFRLNDNFRLSRSLLSNFITVFQQQRAYAVQNTYHLWINIVQMILNELNRGSQISGVKLIRDIPSQRTELTALLHNGV